MSEVKSQNDIRISVLEERLEVATKALEEIAQSDWNMLLPTSAMYANQYRNTAKEAILRMNLIG